MPVDLSASIYAQFMRARKRADQAAKSGDRQTAASGYRQCAKLMHQYAEYASDMVIRAQRIQNAEMFNKLAEQLTGTPGRAEPQQPGSQAEKPEPAQTNVDDYEAEALGLITRTSVSWEDIGGLGEAKKSIKTTYGIALARKPKGVRIDSSKNFLLYGPPGTGKTLLAAATAGSLEANFFSVTVPDLLSKYFGESTKLASALYRVARRLAPSVIFLDEFDAVSSSRESSDSGAERRLVSTFLSELDGLAGKDDDQFILTIAATNFPWLLDKAILSRFHPWIYIPLPDEDTRRQIFDIHLIRNGHRTDLSLDELVERTNFYSGREIEKLCVQVIDSMTQRMNPTLESLADQGQKISKEYTLKVGTINAADWETGFRTIVPVADREMLDHYHQWAQNADR